MSDIIYEMDLRLKRFDDKLDKSLKEFDKKAEKTAKKTGLSMGKLIGADLVAGFIASGATATISGIVSTISTSLDVAGNFQAQMNSVKALTGGASPALKEAEALARRLGSTTQFTATEASEGIEMLIKNGRTLTEVNEGLLNSTLSLASATGADLATSADIATDVLSLFNLEAKEFDKAVNGITGTTIKSKFSIDDYALALANGGGVAASTGVDFEEFNAVIAATSSGFSSGQTAGTSFKNFLLRLNPATKDAKNMMEELGLNFFDASGNMKSMAEIADDLQGAFKNLSEEQAINAKRIIFGNDAMETANQLIRGGSEAIIEAEKAIAETNAQDIARERMEGYAGAVKSAKSAMEGLFLTVGVDMGLLQFAENIVNGLANGFRTVSQFIKAIVDEDLVGQFGEQAGPLQESFTGPDGVLNKGSSLLATIFNLYKENEPMIRESLKYLAFQVLPEINNIIGLVFDFMRVSAPQTVKAWKAIASVLDSDIVRGLRSVVSLLEKALNLTNRLLGVRGGTNDSINNAINNAQGVLSASRQNAVGTSYSSGGLNMINERGPELVQLNRGSKVFTAERSNAIVNDNRNMSRNTTINNYSANLNPSFI